MPLLIKICGFTSIQDALCAAGAGADALGLNLWPRSPRALAMAQAKDIAAAVRVRYPSVKIVMLQVSPERKALARAVAMVNPDWLQIHGEWNDDGEFAGVPVVRAFSVAVPDDLKPLASWPHDPVLLDAKVEGKAGGTGVRVPEELLLPLKRPYWLAGGLTPENVAAAIERLRPAGVDTASGVEIAPGKKDPEKMRAFISEARRAASARLSADS